MLLLHIMVRKIANVKTDIVLVIANKITIQQLKKCGLKLAEMFGICQVKPNKK